ncbi:DUF5107 domain-containing protein [Streptomyces sp. NPDC088729]|uniref:DUF5107 domain-containing protein n=1 Tax=Streptomyces sp. NPDC088729 TaxID=3365876 RepID=UPI00380F6D2C
MATTVRRAVLNLPAAPPGPENPLPPLRAPGPPPVAVDAQRSDLPRDMARQLGHRPPRTVLPVRLLDGYGRERTPTALDAVVIENDLLRVTVLPGLGGRVHALRHKPTGRELLHRNPVLQPAAFALNGAWFSGGIEWNIGATGHTTLSCAPLHAAVVPAPDGGTMLRLWEWERLRDLPFQVDLWLPDDSEFLHVGVRVRNPHDHPVPVYWWSNTAVPETPGTRVLVPADTAWHFGYERGLTRVPVPRPGDGADATYPLRGEHPADYFYELSDGGRRWIAALDEDGRGLVQTSTDLLRGRKLFRWGHGPGGRRWQEWLNGPDGGGYAEIQAGLARTQLEHVPLEPGAAFSWLESYGPLHADPAVVHGDDWAAAVAEADGLLARALPRATAEEAYAAWLPCADTEPGERLATGSGWGALEVRRGGHLLPGTPFPADTLGEQQVPWRELLEQGALPPAPAGPPGPTLVSPAWRDMLETAVADAHTEYHLGIAQWHADDRAQAVRSWERGLAARPAPRWPLLRCLAVAARESGRPERAAELYAEAYADLEARDSATGPGGAEETAAAHAALARETIEAHLDAGSHRTARALLAALPERLGALGRFRLLLVRCLVAEGDTAAAREVFDAGFEVADLHEGAEILDELWAAVSDEPLPHAYDFRMRPSG